MAFSTSRTRVRTAARVACVTVALTLGIATAQSATPRAAARAEPSPVVLERIAQYKIGVATYGATTVLLNAELEKIRPTVEQNESARACYNARMPAIDTLVANARAAQAVPTSGHSCNERSPDSCWVPVFDRADAAVEKVTEQARQITAQLAQCRQPGA
ncbi:hypothetical protein [Cognatilysobacter lacus]|uniref:Secreted protein n=1 Tax=Cognatilysobacter lacus TaxID=1643323 RepID=A0A5D8Z7K3_9GAMM|nr:hypothetical protein [Lysobacter lacus]TZF90781.1 hypothetical protein FW784_04025 [Lysobacter lacus]